MVAWHTPAVTLDLTPFDFTPTESLVYGVLVTAGPGTGYAIARTAGLARANAYSALEGLVSKGAARVEGGRPKRYRPEPPPVLLSRIVDRQGRAMDELSQALSEISTPSSRTTIEVTSLRGVTQMLSLEIARARTSVRLFLPASAYPGLAPALRRAAAVPVTLELSADGPVDQAPAPVDVHGSAERWPGPAMLAVIDRRLALVGTMSGDRVEGYWTTGPALVAAADLAIDGLTGR